MEIAGAEQPDQPIPHILLLQQKEDSKDDDDADRLDRLEHRHEECLGHRERGGCRLLHGDGHGLPGDMAWGGGRRGRRQAARMMPSNGRDVAELARQRRHAIGEEAPRRLELLHDRRLVLRQVAGEVGDLRADQRRDEQDDGQRQQHGEDDRQDLRHMDAAEQGDHGSEHEAQQHGERDRDQDRLGQVERCDDDDRHEQDQQSLRPGNLARWHTGAARQRYRVGRFRHRVSLGTIAEALSLDRI